MLIALIDQINRDESIREDFSHVLTEISTPSKTILLKEGEIAGRIFFIRKGCLRMWFNKNGKDITYQFFFEDQAVASMDSFFSREPSLFNIESIEPSVILSLNKDDFDQLLKSSPELREGFQQIVFQRLRVYSRLFLSRIRDTPQERYEDLVKNHPEIIRRIPQHYIASYLGITPISLSRIRNRRQL
jgi:CRP-like cAMP-binding protein